MMFTREKVIKFTKSVLSLGIELKHFARSRAFEITKKEDGTFVTNFDFYSNNRIKKIINEIFPNIKILSEEDDVNTQKDAVLSKNYFCIDPIDGTEYFIENDEFTINIGYCENNIPIFGMALIPTRNIAYVTLNDGVYIVNDNENILKIERKKIIKKQSIACSVNIFTDKQRVNLEEFLKNCNYKPDRIFTRQSGLKFISTILGITDMSITFSPVKDWDLCPFVAMGKFFDLKMVNKYKEEILFGQNDFCHKDGVCLIS